MDFAAFKSIAMKVGALLMVDMAHIAGLVAAGLHPSPVPHAQFVTTTTHKTLRGPPWRHDFVHQGMGHRHEQVFPWHSRRAAHARNCRQSRRLQRGPGTVVQGIPEPGNKERQGAGRSAHGTGVTGWCRVEPTTISCLSTSTSKGITGRDPGSLSTRWASRSTRTAFRSIPGSP